MSKYLFESPEDHPTFQAADGELKALIRQVWDESRKVEAEPVGLQRDYKPCSYDAAFAPCPICSHSAVLLEYTTGPDDEGRSFVVSCDRPSPEEPEDFDCPMNPPPGRFHCDRKKSAVAEWNNYAAQVVATRLAIEAAPGQCAACEARAIPPSQGP